jgi:short-subunit dehydrogenase
VFQLKDDGMAEVAGKTILITGASGGIGRALIDAVVSAGASEVIAASRNLVHPSARVKPVSLDITNVDSVAQFAREHGPRVDILINNAGVSASSGALSAMGLSGGRNEMEVNYFGLLNMLRAFGPIMAQRQSGVIVNMLSMLAHVNLPFMATYCASKAAAYSLTQAIRAELAPAGVLVVGVLPPAVDTPMSAKAIGPKLATADVAAATVRAIIENETDVYPGQIARDFYAAYRADPKAMELKMAARK